MERSSRKKKFGGYPAFGVVLSITLTLFFVGMFGLLLSYTHELEELVRENITLKVYLKSSLSETQRNQIERTLGAKAFVAQTEKPITFVSKEEAKKELIKEVGDYEGVLDDNPFKDVFIVKIDPVHHDTLSLNRIKNEIEHLNGVLDAEYEKILVEAVNKKFTVISLVLIGITVVFIISVIILINNTLRLALFSQRFLIRSMQLVGATKWFIQRPFLFRAGLYGLMAGLLATSMVYILTSLAYQRIEYLIELYNRNHFIILASGMVLIGIILAVVCTFFSIRRYLKMSLDQLY
jgi:cell division transport system permease protein